MGSGGHLFVVRGRAESLQHEAVVVGVDAEGTVHAEDRPLFPDGPPARPRTWAEGWGRSGAVWMVRTSDGSADEVRTHLCRALADVARAGLAPRTGRDRALVCVPVLGLPHGAAPPPDAWLATLLTTLRDQAREHGFDVALVTQDPGEHAAAQQVRRGWEGDLPDELERVAQDLATRARAGSLALFLGAGHSAAAGVPERREILRRLVATTEGLTPEETDGLGPDELAALLELHDAESLGKRVAAEVGAVERPGLVHALLAALEVTEVVTTAQDDLYVRAVHDATGVRPRLLGSTTADDEGSSLAWVAPLRGEVDRPESLVVRAVDPPLPAASLLRGLTLTRHLLVVGSELDEPELVRALRHAGDPLPGPRCGTHLDAGTAGRQARAALYGDRLARVRLAGVDEDVGAKRALELLLDRVATHRSDPEVLLLDERFSGSLAPLDQVWATQLRSVLGLLPGDSSTWAPLTRRVAELGG